MKSCKLDKIQHFINNYMKGSMIEDRGKMYGSLEQLESNWILLNHIDLILNDLDENKSGYSQFLLEKGYGAKSASTIIKEKRNKDPYTELVRIWNEYIEWRNEANK